MLDPPISQADIDNRTLFRTRGGGSGIITTHAPQCACSWHVQYDCHVDIPWVTDGGYWHSGEFKQSPHDLIARIPKEPEMQSQVIVEDRRTQNDSPHWQTYSALPVNSLFSTKAEGIIWRKLDSKYRELIAGSDSGVLLCETYHDCECFPLPHLRLRMILEEKP